MGYERKRGALLTFNDYLLTGDLVTYRGLAGPVADLVGARYVITLDEDNYLPDAGAHKLIARMLQSESVLAIDAEKRLVRAGNAVLQPLIASVADPQRCTRYEQLALAGSNELPPLDAIYLRLYDEVPYLGRGIYCVKTFQTVLRTRFPDEVVLSHDILEGCYLHCGLIDEVKVTERLPPTIPMSCGACTGGYVAISKICPGLYVACASKRPGNAAIHSHRSLGGDLRVVCGAGLRPLSCYYRRRRDVRA